MAENVNASIVTPQIYTATPSVAYVRRPYFRANVDAPYPVFTHIYLDIGAAPRQRHWR